MARFRWDLTADYREVVLEPELDERPCAHCGAYTYIYEHRDRRLFAFGGPMHLVSKLAHCAKKDCPGHREVLMSAEEMAISPPYWTIGWDVFAWIGHRRFARHWSVPQIRAELKDSYDIKLSADAIEEYVKRYEVMVAAQQSAPEQLLKEYGDVKDLLLSVDGLQPEKGHEALYVVRELRLQRIWFAVPLLSSTKEELKKHVFEVAAEWVKRLDKPVRLWVSDKQEALVSGIATVFAGVPHRYCKNHFLRDLAKPVLEQDSHAKVQMRHKVRGLSAVERQIQEADRRATELSTSTGNTESPKLADDTPDATTQAASKTQAAPETQARQVVLGYAATIRGIINDDQGGPLDPPGLRMAEALGEVRESLRRCEEKGGLVNANSASSGPASTRESPKRRRSSPKSNRAWSSCALSTAR